MKYYDENGHLTKAGGRLSRRAQKIIRPLIVPSKSGWEAKERELVVVSAVSAVRLMTALKMRLRKSKKGKDTA